MHASPPGKGGQRPSACISSRITTVIQVGEERATKGTITDLMSHSQFHCTGRAYLDMHGLIFETSICYWQRSEEHTSELQSHSDLVCRLLLEKKKKKKYNKIEKRKNKKKIKNKNREEYNTR